MSAFRSISPATPAATGAGAGPNTTTTTCTSSASGGTSTSRSWPSKCRTAPGPANSGPAPTPPTSQSSPRTRARADAVPCTRSEHQAVRQAIVADLHVEKAAAYIAAVADPWHVGLCGGAGRYPHRRAHRHTSLVQREQQRVEADRLEAVGRKAPGIEVEHAVATEVGDPVGLLGRSEEHTSELQSLMRISYAVFCLKKKKTK